MLHLRHLLLLVSALMFLTGLLGPCSKPWLYEPSHDMWWDITARANPRPLAKWTPDGSNIVMSWSGTMFTIRSDGSSVRKISAGGEYAVDYWPDISPDGSRIVYTTSRHLIEGKGLSGIFEIETSGIDGSDRQRLTTSVSVYTSPTWSPDGTRIAFVNEGQDGGDQNRGIYIMSPDGLAMTGIMRFPSDIHGPATGNGIVYQEHHGPLMWSPDGHLIAAVLKEAMRVDNGSDIVQRYALYVVNVNTNKVTRLFAAKNIMIDGIGRWPAWSPDGRSLAFMYLQVRDRTKMWTLYTIDAEGSELREVPGTARQFWKHKPPSSVSWSPDGEKIAVSLDDQRDSVNEIVYVVDTNGYAIRLIGEGAHASWSPDGSRICILRLSNEHHPYFIVLTVAPDGSDSQVLAKRDDQGRVVAMNAQ